MAIIFYENIEKEICSALILLAVTIVYTVKSFYNIFLLDLKKDISCFFLSLY